jgi:P-type conjugative transfer protein TrbG
LARPEAKCESFANSRPSIPSASDKQNFVQAVDLCRADGGVALAKALTGLAQIERDVGRRDLARPHYEEALAIYRIEGDAPWKPRQVFDDGIKVYIQFPSGLAQSEAPPLFVIGPDGKPALVNYRVRGTTYIVDRLFAAAELRLGTAPQRVVRIVRTDAVWREITQ